MVHVAPDSRLLVSLITREQAYAAQLQSVLNAAGTSLAALAAYASSSPPTISPVLNGIAGAFAVADGALRTYGESLNDWIYHLGRIKEKEAEVANIGRDREILVTRLLKVSQKSKSPQSLIQAVPDPSSSTSFATFSSKLNSAQVELQACESHLAEQERELESVRLQAIKEGLNHRIRALIECGRVWDEIGRRSIQTLDTLDGTHKQSNGHATEFYKPLPDPTRDHDHDSLISSLTPSQSASQTGAVSLSTDPPSTVKAYRLDIPPPHLVTDGNIFPEASEPEGGGSSSEDAGPVEVHENPRFSSASIKKRGMKTTAQGMFSPSRKAPIPFPDTSSSDLGPLKLRPVEKKKRTGLLGNIVTLFRTSKTKGAAASDGGWTTRTDQYLRESKTDAEQSSDEDSGQLRKGRLRKGEYRPPASALGSTVRNGEARSDLDVSATLPRRRRNVTLGRNSSLRSTISEPQAVPRPRAQTLTSASLQRQLAIDNVRRHGRTASMDGRGALTDNDVDAAHLPTWKSANGQGDSLMRLVDNPPNDDPSSRLVTIRAPSGIINGPPLLVHPPPPLPAPASTPSSPVTSKTMDSKRSSLPIPTTVSPGVLVMSSPVGAYEKKPLRSAMRKSPSPSRSPSARATADAKEQPSTILSLSPSSPSSSRRISMSRPEIPSTIIESPRQSVVEPITDAHRSSYASRETDDSVSISSYETGHENFDDEETGQTHKETLLSGAALSSPSRTPLLSGPTTSPMKEKTTPPSSNVNGLEGKESTDHQEVASTASTDTAAPPSRKSVRMSSLPPQVSATPPALDEYNDANHLPWSNGPSQSHSDSGSGWQTRVQVREAAFSWDDSSSEEEAYKTAKRALNFAASKTAEKGKR